MPIPLATPRNLIPLSDGNQRWPQGFVPPNYGNKDLQDTINPGVNLRQTNPLGWQTINKQNLGNAFQNLLNQITVNPASHKQNMQRFTDALNGKPVVEPMFNPDDLKGKAIGNVFGVLNDQTNSGHNPDADRLLNALQTGAINVADETGTVSLTPGGLQVASRNGWQAGFNPYGGNINIGPFGIQGTWAGDKSIQATVNFGKNQNDMTDMPIMMNEFITPTIREPNSYPYYGFGLDQKVPSSIAKPSVEVPLSAGRQLMEEQTDEYMRRNPNYRYQ